MTALRPLYVDHGAAAVRLEGPALIVDQPDCAEGRFPLRLLSRVVVRGPVPWSMEALFACLASSVPITFLSLDGAVVGLCLGRDRPEESLAMLLDRLLAEPGWAEIYQRWCKAAERRAIVEAARRLALPVGTDLRPEVVRALTASHMPGGDTPGARSAMRRLDGYLCAHLSELVRPRRGSARISRRTRAQPLDLRPGFRGALRWYLWLPLQALAGAAAKPSAAARRGERGAPSGGRAIRGRALRRSPRGFAACSPRSTGCCGRRCGEARDGLARLLRHRRAAPPGAGVACGPRVRRAIAILGLLGAARRHRARRGVGRDRHPHRPARATMSASIRCRRMSRSPGSAATWCRLASISATRCCAASDNRVAAICRIRYY